MSSIASFKMFFCISTVGIKTLHLLHLVSQHKNKSPIVVNCLRRMHISCLNNKGLLRIKMRPKAFFNRKNAKQLDLKSALWTGRTWELALHALNNHSRDRTALGVITRSNQQGAHSAASLLPEGSREVKSRSFQRPPVKSTVRYEH